MYQLCCMSKLPLLCSGYLTCSEQMAIVWLAIHIDEARTSQNKYEHYLISGYFQ